MLLVSRCPVLSPLSLSGCCANGGMIRFFQFMQFRAIFLHQESEPAAGTESIALRVAVAPARGIAGKVAQEGRYCEREEKTKGRNVDAIYFSML